jgi:hypothetical protein
VLQLALETALRSAKSRRLKTKSSCEKYGRRQSDNKMWNSWWARASYCLLSPRQSAAKSGRSITLFKVF